MGIYGHNDKLRKNSDDVQVCRHCGAIKSFRANTNFKKCWSCKKRYKPIHGKVTIFCLLVVMFVVLYIRYSNLIHDYFDYLQNVYFSDTKTVISAEPVYAVLPEDLNTPEFMTFPDHGSFRINPELERVAPFTIITPADNNFLYYYILLVRENDGEKIIIYLNPGEEYTLAVPLGSYQFYHASGRNWYGDFELFGRHTDVFKSDEIFEFYIDEENSIIMGLTIILQASIHDQGERLEGERVNRNEILDILRGVD
jgi:ribosomal protein L40E